jgi:hypothetical protein
MYVYFIPQGGFYDILSNIKRTIDYCNKTNRIMLLDMANSLYKINFCDYFELNDKKHIFVINKIKEIITERKYSVKPKILENKLLNLLNEELELKYVPKVAGHFAYEDILLTIDGSEEIIVHSRCGRADGWKMFQEMKLSNELINYAKENYKKMNKPYISIQVRATDKNCNYRELLKKNNNTIKNANEIYIATDSKPVIGYFKNYNKNVKNFTTYSNEKCRSLHYAPLSGDIKMKDLISDLYIVGKSEQVITNSAGGYVYLCLMLNRNKNILDKMFNN